MNGSETRAHMDMKYLNDAGGRFKLPLKNDAGKTLCTLIWGDPLHEPAREGTGAAERVKVRARRRIGWLPASAVGDTGLLEIYVIDVGQGDGVLMRTPQDDAWHMIDAGIKAASQMTNKGAANFVRWKFIDDLQRDGVHFANMVVTHPDTDHYGGMIELLSGLLPDGRTFGIEVDRFWHCGIGRFSGADPLGAQRADTSTTKLPNPCFGIEPAGRFIVEMLDGKTPSGRPKRPFTREFAALAELVGKVPMKVSSLAQTDNWLPGYAPAEGAASIRVLGPVVQRLAGGGSRGCATWAATASRATAIRWCCVWTMATRDCCSPVT